jgi:rhodanese-related sulfurtransferase
MNETRTRPGKIVQIDNARLQALLAQGVAIVDIRRPEEWRTTGIVAGSHLLTFFDEDGRCEPTAWLAQLRPLIAPGQPMILICRTGHRTNLICDLLSETTDYRELYNVADGILGWIAGNYPVVRWPVAV